MRSFALSASLGGVIAIPLLSALLVGCGAASGASGAAAAATSTCPPPSTLKTVTGHVTIVSADALTVTDSNGAATSVQLSSTTRVTRITSIPATSLSNGTAVLVLTDTNATIAQRISVLESTATGGSGGAGGSGNGSGRFSGTPAAGRNPSCFQRGGQGGGSGQGNGFQGLRGTIKSVTSSKVVFDDSQGQTYSVAITATTAIQRTDQAKVSDLAAGMAVMATGTASSKGIAARTITIQG
jgi:hypothetical protein